MKVALCLSGELRRAQLFYPIIYKHILEPYNPDVFVSTWDMPPNIPTSVAETVRDPLELASLDEIKEMYEPVAVHTQQYSLEIKTFLKSIGGTNTDNILCMSYNIMKANSLSKDREVLTNTVYDIVIRHRFDHVVRNIKLEDYDLTKINILDGHEYGGYNDMFAFGDRDSMDIYSSWFLNLSIIENAFARETGLPTNLHDRKYYPWQPEGSLKRFLDKAGATPNIIYNDSQDKPMHTHAIFPWEPAEEIIAKGED